MNGGTRAHGYTIVEVLIFMAVSGLMFVVAAVFVNGKQANVEFKQGLYGINSDIRTVINEVADGRYQPLTYGGSRYSCRAPTTFPFFPIFLSSPKEQGTGGGIDGCVFLGKVLQFNVADRAPDNAKYVNIFTIVGRQNKPSTKNEAVTSFADALPVPVVASSSSPNLTITKQLEAGTELVGMFFCKDDPCTVPMRESISMIGFFGSFNKALGTESGSAQSGSQTVTAAAIKTAVAGSVDTSTAAHDIKTSTHSLTTAEMLGSGNYALLCLRNGTKKGAISIGGRNGQQFSTQVQIGVVPGC